jgi:haloacetate dehalogenase
MMHKQFDIEAEWRKRCVNVRTASLPGGHFFIDTLPEETARVLGELLER